ncbi:MAG: hypothetical protein FWD39_02000 [Clostridiales bacterium]|nr:hypothetical protein [Clostridiales bacterium]
MMRNPGDIIKNISVRPAAMNFNIYQVERPIMFQKFRAVPAIAAAPKTKVKGAPSAQDKQFRQAPLDWWEG